MTEQDQDPFDDARSGFVKLDDLVGRAVLVVPLSIVTKQSTLRGQEGKPYDTVTSDVIVLDGEPSETIGEEIPTVISGMFLSGSVVVNQLRSKVKTHKMTLGRVATQKAQTRGFNDAFVLSEIPKDDKIRKVARTEAQKYLDSQQSPFAEV